MGKFLAAHANARAALGALGAAGLFFAAGCSQQDDIQGPGIAGSIDEALAPTGGLIGEWNLDGDGMDTKSGNNATIMGGAGFVTSQLGSALNLNNGTTGTGGKYAQIPSAAALDTVQRNDYSISAWFKPYSLPPNDSLGNRFSTIVAKPTPHMGLVYNYAGKFVVRHFLTGQVLQISPSTATYPINVWHHVVGTVNKAAGTIKVYVDGNLDGTATFTPGTAALEYGTTAFRIGKTDDSWAANGAVDQVRIYNRELSAQDVTDLFNETAPSNPPAARFYVGMSKEAIADSAISVWTPDGKFQQVGVDLSVLLRAAHAQGRRVIIKVTKDNGQYKDATGHFVLSGWKADFDRVAQYTDTLREYMRNGTLVGNYALDEPFSDFTAFNPADLDHVCAYQKQFWPFVPCLIRERNTRMKTKADSAGYTYTQVDAGWAQLANNHLPQPHVLTSATVLQYYKDELAAGEAMGLALMYGFNLLDGGTTVSSCATPDSDQCAMTASELRMAADAIASIANDPSIPHKGCGVNGWIVKSAAGSARDYYLNSGIQDALHYLWDHTAGAGMDPGFCSLRNLPAP